MLAFSLLVAWLVRVLLDYSGLDRLELDSYAPWAYFAVLIITILSNATIIVPAPGIAFVIAISLHWNPLIVAAVASLGNAIGELGGYFAGRLGNRMVRVENWKGYQFVQNWVGRYGAWTVSILAFIPLVLFDVVGLAAGGMKMPVLRFFMATWLGRIPRSYVEVFAGASLVQLVLPGWFN
jgi:membrane protein YqaA with SNARE-associated domain